MATPTYSSLSSPEDNLRSLIASQEDGGATAAKPNGAEPIGVLQAKAAFNADQKADRAAGSLEEKADLIDGKLDPAQVPDVIDARLQVLTGTDAALANEVLLSGEIAAPTDAMGLRKGDGVTPGGSLVGRIATPATAAAGTSSTECVGPNGLLVVGTLASGANSGSIKANSSLLGSGSVAPATLGMGSIDLQLIRASSSQTASGGGAAVLGGGNNTASGGGSITCGGTTNSNSGANGFIGAGTLNSVTGSNAIVGGGSSNTAKNFGAAVFGGTTNQVASSAPASVPCYGFVGGGANNSVTQNYGAVVGGFYGLADRYGMSAYAGGFFAARGDAQRVDFVARNKTTTNSAVTLFLDGSSTRLTIPSGKVLAATVNVSGVKSDGSAMAHFIRKISIKNMGGTTTLVSESTVGTDDAAGTSLAITADDTNDALEIAVTGITSETWRWVAHIEGVEIAYGT